MHKSRHTFLLLVSFPFRYPILVPLALLLVALVAEALKVAPIEEEIGADGERDDVVNAGGWFDDPFGLARLAEGMADTEGGRQSRPPCGMVKTVRPITIIPAIRAVNLVF